MRELIASTLIIFSSFLSLSQEGPKVVVFNESEQTEPEITAFNLIKISLLEAMSGDISLYYERVLSQNTSAEFGLGFTIDDYFGSIIFDDGNSSFYDTRTPLIGYSFGLGFRYYPFIAGDEFYFAPEIKYRFYHSEEIIGTGIDQQTLEESKTFFNGRITAGYNLYFDDKIFMDFYAGIGLAMFNYKEYEAVYNDQTFEYDYLLRETKIPRPWLTLGVKFGFGFN